MFADVTSANVVGYANRTATTAKKYYMVCSQFQQMGKEASTMTLGALVPSANWKTANDYVKIFANNSKVELSARYVNDAALESVKRVNPDATIGWYDLKDETYTTCINDRILPLGGTVMAYMTVKNSYITTSGEVITSQDKKIQFDFPTAKKYYMIGNCTPVPLTLGNFIPSANWKTANDYMKVFANNSKVEKSVRYVNEAALESVKRVNPDATIGWYDLKDEAYATNLNDEPVEAGSGFMVYATVKNSYIQIPTAL